MTGSRLVAAHRLRLRERERYLKANPGGEERWQRYEQLIWDKYAPGEPLDVAWLNRNEAHAKRGRSRSRATLPTPSCSRDGGALGDGVLVFAQDGRRRSP